MTDTNETQVEVTQAAIAEASEVRFHEGIPVRVVERNGRAIWSMVDDENRDLTNENSDGLLYHVHSLFVPHGAENPLTRIQAEKRTAPRQVVEALEPFAAALHEWGDEPSHQDLRDLWDHPLSQCITIGDFRRASAALASLTTQNNALAVEAENLRYIETVMAEAQEALCGNDEVCIDASGNDTLHIARGHLFRILAALEGDE